MHDKFLSNSHSSMNNVTKIAFLFDRFIEKYGTHIVVGLSIGGQDVVLVKQDKSSNLEPSELKTHLENLGDQLFTGTCSFAPKSKEHKHKVCKSSIIIINTLI